MDTTKTITHIGLCAGYGGIELGLARVLPTLRSVALCEIEAFPIANLVAKMEAGLMESAPIWTDLKTFPWESFRDRVDILTGGYPCQPFSAAGKRAGKEDPRHLWPWIADGIRILRPRVCFFENVEGHISLGLSSVISDLEELGYKVSWGIFSAREVGAPHQRKRVFILAHDAHGEQRAWSLLRQDWQGAALLERCGSRRAEELADSQCAGLEGVWECCSTEGREAQTGYAGSGCNVWPSRPGEPQHGWEPPRVVGAIPAKLADFCSRHSQSWGDTAQAGGESTCERREGADAMPHGGSSVCGGNQGDEPEVVGNADHGRLASGLNARSGTEADRGGQSDIEQADGSAMGNSESEQSSSRDHRGQQGSLGEQEQVQLGGGDCGALRESNWQAQPPLGGNPDGPADWMDYAELYTTCDNRTDELRLLGNGVVPATAERAFRTLIKELL